MSILYCEHFTEFSGIEQGEVRVVIKVPLLWRRFAIMTIISCEWLVLNSSETINNRLYICCILFSDGFRDLDDIEARMSSEPEKKRFCSSKITLILLLIVIGLFSLIALIISIYSLVLTINHNKNGTHILYSGITTDTIEQITSNFNIHSMFTRCMKILFFVDSYCCLSTNLHLESYNNLSICDRHSASMSELHGQ